MPRLFKYKENSIRVAGPDAKLARTLLPNEDGNVIDVIGKFPWTLTPYNSPARLETPYIKLKEFYLLDNYINQLLKSYSLNPINTTASGRDFALDALGTLTDLGTATVGLGTSKTLYKGLYDHVNPTGFEYKLPYFENGQTNINTWTHKSTYDFIVQMQQKLAPFLGAEVLASFDFDGFFGLGSLFQSAAGYYKEVLESGLNIATGQGTLGDWGELFWAATKRIGVSKIPIVGPIVGPTFDKAIKIYEKIAPQVYTAQRAIELMEIALDTSMGTMGAGQDPVIDKPLLWTSSQPRNFVVSFPLFNTDLFGDVNAEKTLVRNWELCYLLTYQNLYNKKNLYKGIPPVFYEIEVPGIHYTKAGYVNDLKIVNIGNTRLIELPVGSSGEKRPVNIPDAYFITMSLIDFFMPSKNFLDTINFEKDPTARNRVKASFSASDATPSQGSGVPLDQIPNPFNPLDFLPGSGGPLGPSGGSSGGGGPLGPGGASFAPPRGNVPD